MKTASIRLRLLVVLIALAAGLVALPAEAQSECWKCNKVGFFCPILMPCNYVCETAYPGDGHQCQQWFTNGVFFCNTLGGTCVELEIVGETPDCIDYCPA